MQEHVVEIRNVFAGGRWTYETVVDPEPDPNVGENWLVVARYVVRGVTRGRAAAAVAAFLARDRPPAMGMVTETYISVATQKYRARERHPEPDPNAAVTAAADMIRGWAG